MLLALAAACDGPRSALRDPSSDLPVAPVVVRAAVLWGGAADAQQGSAAASLARAPAPVGHLERRDRLAHLFEAFARLDEGGAPERVRIAQFGDSHTASDLGVSVVRRELQARFGDGGRGFVSLGKPWQGYWQKGLHVGMTAGFEPVKVKYKGGAFEGLDGAYGLLGVGVATSAAGESAWTEVLDPTTHVEVDGWRQPGGGSFDVLVDGVLAGRAGTRAAPAESGVWAFDVPEGPHKIEIRSAGDGDVRVFGMSLDRGRGGVVVDALGINGAQVFTPLRSNEAHFVEQLKHRGPDLVILAYGTNEAVEPSLTDAAFEQGLVQLLGRVARGAPAASCLLLGPPDLARRASSRDPWVTVPRILEIVALERTVAEAGGCAFYDQLAAMGGPGTIAAWASEAEPRALRDRVHLSRDGYAQVAMRFSDDLLRAYDDWRFDHGLPRANAPKTWGVAVRRE